MKTAAKGVSDEWHWECPLFVQIVFKGRHRKASQANFEVGQYNWFLVSVLGEADLMPSAAIPLLYYNMPVSCNALSKSMPKIVTETLCCNLSVSHHPLNCHALSQGAICLLLCCNLWIQFGQLPTTVSLLNRSLRQYPCIYYQYFLFLKPLYRHWFSRQKPSRQVRECCWTT